MGERMETRGKQPFYIKLAVFAVCALAFLGGGAAFAAILSDGAPEEPEVVEPETIQATVKVDGVLIPGPTLQRGDELQNIEPADELTGAYAGQYYRADYGEQTVYLPKAWVRTADEAAPEQWTGFAAQDAIIFSKPNLSGDDILTLSLNEEVQVLDEFNGLVYVKNADGAEGYMPADKVLREKAPEQTAPAASASRPSSSSSKGSGSSGSSSSNKKPSSGSSSSSGNSGSSGSTGGGSGSTGGSSSGGSSGSSSNDGDDMTLPTAVSYASFSGRSLLGVEIAYADEPKDDFAESAVEGSGLSGVVLAADTVTYMGMLNRGDSVTVKVDEKLGASDALTEEEIAALSPEEKAELGTLEDVCTVVINDQEFELAEKLLRLETDTPYEVWDGFAVKDAVAYTDYQLTVNPLALDQNAAIHVVDFVGDVLIVEINGATYFMATPTVSQEETEVIEEEEPAQTTARPSSSSSGSGKKPSSSSSSSSGGSSSSGSSSSGSSGSGSSGGSSASSDSSGSGGAGGTSEPEPEWSAPIL